MTKETKKEIVIYFCETPNVGKQHEINKEYSKWNLEYAEQQFKMWANCYMVKVKTIYDDDTVADEILYKRNIIF